MLCATGCASKPATISGDLSCERFRHIAATPAQIGAMSADWGLWESYGLQVAAHNVEYDKACLKPLPK